MMKILSCLLLISLMAQNAHGLDNEVAVDTVYLNSIGDWGDKDSVKYKTSQWATETAEHGVILIGDNYYPKGVASVTDKLFTSIFEKGFRTTDVGKTRKYYAVAGNHDHYGNVDAQIQYASTHDYWTFPSLYYTNIFKSNDATVSVFVVFTDSWGLNGGDTLMHFNAQTGKTSIRSKELLESMVESGDIAEDVAEELKEKFPFQSQNLKSSTPDEVQFDWIEDQLNSAEAKAADWLIVVGHYPLYSCSKGEHGDTSYLIDRLKNMFSAYNVDAYINGHDHILQHIKVDGINYFGSGAGAQKHKPIDVNHIGYQFAQGGYYGYMEHTFTKTSFKTTFYANVKNVKKQVYSHEETKP